MKIKAQTLKGFRDFLPNEARKRQFVLSILKKVFESYGFEPLETPSLEYQEILAGKYGEEGEKLMYKFEDLGKRKVALRYDQTVPLARIISQYQNEIVFPFKRYQIQNVWRAENTQKGRYREFLQCDIDTVGTSSPLSDAEIIKVTIEALKKLGFKKIKAFINDRQNISNLNPGFIIDEKDFPFIFRCIDKIVKTGRAKVIEELSKKYSTEQSEKIMDAFKKLKPNQNLTDIFNYLDKLGVDRDDYKFDPYLARGIDYYTGLIFEIDVEGYKVGSVVGGGRYDNLIGIFSNKSIPAVGAAFGFDRVLEAMDLLNLFPVEIRKTDVLITVFSPKLLNYSIKAYNLLEKSNIKKELYLDDKANLEKQLKYANKKNIPYAVIIGPNEVSKNDVIIRNMETREQKMVKLEKLADELKK